MTAAIARQVQLSVAASKGRSCSSTANASSSGSAVSVSTGCAVSAGAAGGCLANAKRGLACSGNGVKRVTRRVGLVLGCGRGAIVERAPRRRCRLPQSPSTLIAGWHLRAAASRGAWGKTADLAADCGALLLARSCWYGKQRGNMPLWASSSSISSCRWWRRTSIATVMLLVVGTCVQAGIYVSTPWSCWCGAGSAPYRLPPLRRADEFYIRLLTMDIEY